MATSSEVLVIFVSAPRVGERASMLINGSPVTSSTVRSVTPSLERPGYLCVETQSGSRYTGMVGGESTVYGMASAPLAAYPPAPVNQQLYAAAWTDGTAYLVAACILAVISLMIFPPFFGMIAIMLSGIAISKGHRYGLHVLIGAAVCMLVGMFFGMLAETVMQMLRLRYVQEITGA